ncbi:MAG: MFS transporter, partial [Blautia sp.]|nr:MFS transporter [Blautia sp.]
AASLFAIYLMPMGMPKPLQAVYMFITYNLSSTICYTMSYVAYMTLNGLMTTDQISRGNNAAIQMIGNVIIGLVGNSTIISLLTALSKDKS